MEDTRLVNFAYEQADLVRDRAQSKEDALARIAEHFPALTPDEVLKAYNRGLFESR